jgi:uncharacterized protein YdhG (YjbR/CyaY superfamily)
VAKTNFRSVDEYIAACPVQARGHVQKIRETIQAVVPEAREKISYQIGAFELNGKNLIGFAGWNAHVSIYPIPAGNKAFNARVSKFADGKGTLKFALDKPLPLELIREIVKFRTADVVKSAGTKKY